jgi:chromosome segregation ATPase
MNQKIEIADERVSDTNPIAVAKENIKVAITESKPQTLQVWQNEKVEEVFLEVMQEPIQTTLKDVDADISNLEIQLSQAEAQVANLTAELAKKRTLKTDLEAIINPVYDKLQVDIANKPTETPVEEVLP